jgi:N-acetylated-alpha-linked acidic dipeptidase
LQHLGLTTLDVSYGGESDGDGVYHSNYDSYDHYIRYGDPGFAYGIAEAQTVGHIILRIADADVLPMQFGAFADTVDGYVTELHELTDSRRKTAVELGKLIDDNAFKLATDPTRAILAPEREPEVPHLNFAPLDNAVDRVKKSTKAYDEAYSKLLAGQAKLTPAQLKDLNSQLRGMEAALTDPRGLPGRDWFKHLIYAPGLYTGYGVKTVPGVREAIEQNQFDEANQYSALTAAALNSYCDRLDKATLVLLARH